MRWRFRTVLVLTMLVLLVAMALITVTSFLSARDMAADLSGKVLALAAGRTEDSARRLLSVATDEVNLDRTLFTSGRIDPHDKEAVIDYFVDAIRAHREISSLSWQLDKTADLVEIDRDRAGHIDIIDQRLAPEGGIELNLYEVDGAERRSLGTRFDKNNPGPLGRPYYLAAKAAKAPTWTESYVFVPTAHRQATPGLTRVAPVYDQGELVGVLTADFDLDALSAFIRDLPIGTRGTAFVIELRADGTRRVIAHADPAVVVTKSGEPLAANQVAEPRVRAFMPAFDASVGTAAPGALIPVEFDAEGTHYLGGYRLLEGDLGLRWAVALGMPEDDILGPVKESRRRNVVIALAATLLGVLVAVILGLRFGAALRFLTGETERIGDFELAQRSLVDSRIVEIRQLSTAIEDMKRGLRSFRKFVPAELVRRLVQSNDEAMQGGRRQRITVHFSDIAGFTSFSERLSPEELVELLNDYLSLVSEEIVASGGTLDKYIGDAVMAFWNSPTPVEDHAFIACKAALENKRRVLARRAFWAERGWPPIGCRVGIHTGEAVVGNIGSNARLDFTAIGDTVNLASRLEGLGKVYGVDILISETTLADVAGRVVVRPLDRVVVKGREGHVMIYELIGLDADVTAKERAHAERHGRALEAYFARNWSETLSLLDGAAEHDLAAALLKARALELQASAPDEGWDGVHRMKTK